MSWFRERWSLALLGVTLVVGSTALGCGDVADRAGEAGSAVRPTPAEARLRVQVDSVRRASLGGAGRVTGTVRAFHRARITAETQGRVIARTEPGAQVEEGGLLVELESERLALELRRAEASLRAAKTVRQHAQREFDRGERLVAESAISAQRQDDLRLALDRSRDELALAEVARDTARRNLADARIQAPFAGTVDSIDVNVGDYVAPGTPVATMVDLSRVRIFGGVTAKEAARLTPGSVAQVSFADLDGQTFDATLQRIGRVADPADGTYEIELWLDSSETAMRDGLVARVLLPSGGDDEYILAPRAALLRRDGQPEVFVVERENGRSIARSRVIRTGRSDGQWIEVLDGLESGEHVVFDGQFALEDGSIVEIDGDLPQGAVEVTARKPPVAPATPAMPASEAVPTSVE